MTRARIAALIMFIYADLMIIGGIAAYFMAPEGANAMTALIVPGAAASLMILCCLLTLMMSKSKPLGMLGIHLGLGLPLLYAIGIGHRAYATMGAVSSYQEQREAFEATSPAVDDAEAFKAYLAANDLTESVPDHDKSYLFYTLAGLSGLSVVAFIALVAVRPRKEDRVAAAE